MKPTVRLVFGVALFSLFFSGLAGLVYEIVWGRYLALFLGHTSYAVVAVLVAFMGGLAVGNAWFGRLADRSRRPLALYAWLEVGIGAYALLFPAYYSWCERLFVALAQRAEPGGAMLLWLKFGFSLLTILLPTVLMGGTLPVLTRLATRSLGELREKVAALYFINSAGAVAGCFVADYWLIPTLGLKATVLAAAALNLLVGLLALTVNHWLEHHPTAWVPTTVPPTSSEETFTPQEVKLAVVGIGISGFVAMLYEVAWTRLLALALGSSTHAFSLMLITFIAGIAAGALAVCRWKRLRRTLAAFGWLELALAAAVCGSMFLYEWLPYWFVKLAGLLARREEAYPAYELLQGLVCFTVMFVPATCLGMTLPLASRVATLGLAQTGRSVGIVFAVNTAGTVLGTVVTGLWLMPALGLARTFAVGVVLNAAIGVMILGRGWWPGRRPLAALGLPVAVGAVWLAGWTFDSRWQMALNLSLWRLAEVPRSAAEYRQKVEAFQPIYYRDGAGSTVCVHPYPDQQGDQLILRVNGKVEASTANDVPTQLLLGHIPMLLRPGAEQALVIGLGSGMTCGAVTRHPSLRRLDVVEISPEVVAAARLYSAFNHHVLDDPRVRVFTEDAKTFLHLTPQRYDVIISEPSNPWMAGVAGVFSQEHYQSCSQRLAPGGIMLQWIHLYETSDEALDMVIATFASVFTYTSLWQGLSKDLMLVGSTEPLEVDLAALERRLADPQVNADLKRCGVTRVPLFLSLEMVSPRHGFFLPPIGTRLQSDFYPVLEYVAERNLFVRRTAEGWRRYQETYSTRPTILLGTYLEQHPLVEADFDAFLNLYAFHHLLRRDLLRSLLHRWQQAFPDAMVPIEADALLPEPPDASELRALRLASIRDQLFARAATDPDPLRTYAHHLMQAYRSQRSVFFLPPTTELQAVLARLLEVDRRQPRLHHAHLAELAWDRGDDEECLRQADAAFDPAREGPFDFSLDPQAPAAVVTRTVEVLGRRGRLQEAWQLCRRCRDDPDLCDDNGQLDPALGLVFRKTQFAVEALSQSRNLPSP